MILKERQNGNEECKVTFIVPASVNALSVNLCGEFNNWNRSADCMERCEDGSFMLAMNLAAGRRFRFRYLLDGERWENDWAADSYTPNPFGSNDSVVET